MLTCVLRFRAFHSLLICAVIALCLFSLCLLVRMGPFQYEVCGQKFNYRKNFRQHALTFHSEHSDKIVHKCYVCDKDFVHKRNLSRHLRDIHGLQTPDLLLNKAASNKSVEFVPPPAIYQCHVCDKNFRYKKNMYCHLREFHHVQVQTFVYKCVLCSAESSTKEDWQNHLQSVHEIHVQSEDLQFSTEEEFLQWKEETERRTHSKFIKVRGSRTTSRFSYSCHRSGSFIPKGKGMRHLKLTGSNKMNGKCPAEMKVFIQDDGMYHVNFVSTHVGHLQELRHLPLSNKDRESIATDIALGIPYRTVLDKIRESVEDSNLERIHVTTMQDIYNIAASYNLSSKSVRHQNDAISVDAWVRDMNESENPCVLFYKQQQSTASEHPELRYEDFMLVIMNSAQREVLLKYGHDCICIDGTHGLNGYDFEVTTLLVLDDLRQGFPVAFLISNRKDAEAISIFLLYVKSQVGPICPKVFMSDLAEAYNIAWQRIMGPPDSRLFCTWHVDRAWKTNLKNKIVDIDKRNEVYRLIKSISLLRDVDLFEESLHRAVQKLSNDPDTSEFASYFNSNYARNTKSWAYCYRMHAGLNTNMHVESMHRTLKEIHGNARQIKRLDKGIATLMSLVTAKMFDRLIINVKGKVSSKVKNIRHRHKSSLLINKDQITKVNGGWEVQSGKSSEVYLVKENREDCECRLMCSECNVCIHRYYCTCIEYSIKFNMCKHIHAVCLIDSGDENPEVPTASKINVDSASVRPDEREAILAQISRKSIPETPESVFEEKQKILSMFTNILNGMTPSELQFARKTVLTLKANVGAVRVRNRSCFRGTDRNQKRKLIPQRRLFSTKKKTSHTIPLAVPDAEERREILNTLLDLDTNLNVVEQGSKISQSDDQHGVQGLDIAMEHSYAMPQLHYITPMLDMPPQGQNGDGMGWEQDLELGPEHSQPHQT